MSRGWKEEAEQEESYWWTAAGIVGTIVGWVLIGAGVLFMVVILRVVLGTIGSFLIG